MTFIQKFLTYIKAHKVITVIVLVVAAFGGYQWYKKAHASAGSVQYITKAAAKTTISVSVSGTGQVSAQNRIDLKPGGSGQVAAELVTVNVKQGDQVKAGQVIATVDQKNNSVALIQAKASLQSAQANYDKLISGLTSTDMQTAQLAVTTAQQALDKANRDYANTVTTQQQNVDKAYSALLNSDLQPDPSDANTTAAVTITGNYTAKDPSQITVSLSEVPAGMRYQSTGLSGDGDLITRGVAQPIGDGLFITFDASGTLNASTVWTIDIPNTKSSGYLNNNFAYNSALQNQTQALASAQDTINSAQNSLTQAQLSLQSKTAPPTSADVASAKAQIAQAQAQLQNADVNYSNNIIKSPFDGQVAQLNNQPGDQVTSSTIIATVITNQKLAVMPLNEVDAAKVSVGQKVNLTFDALDSLNVVGTVAQVDTLGTVSQGVVTYNVKIGFDSQDARIKPGMSVTAAIITDVKTDIVAVPSSAVKSDSNGDYVQVLNSKGEPENKTVQVGISNDTDTEITSGLNEGDMVVTQTINSAAKTTTATTRAGGGIIPGLGGGGGAVRGAFTGGGGGGGGR
ncbi:MAG: efflux RND transporter periplasmic adaptor subunit [Candidatus Doudnabacteria bacterium]